MSDRHARDQQRNLEARLHALVRRSSHASAMGTVMGPRGCCEVGNVCACILVPPHQSERAAYAGRPHVSQATA
jgi:hypothetical protein